MMTPHARLPISTSLGQGRNVENEAPSVGGSIVGVLVGARLTAAGRLEEVSGRVTTKAELARAVRHAREAGEDEGRRAAEEDLRSETEQAVEAATVEGYDAGLSDGRKEAYPIGYTDGHSAGCEQIFDGLDADRVMNFDIFHSGGNWAEYLERAAC
jgi:hypothetical protein